MPQRRPKRARSRARRRAWVRPITFGDPRALSGRESRQTGFPASQSVRFQAQAICPTRRPSPQALRPVPSLQAQTTNTCGCCSGLLKQAAKCLFNWYTALLPHGLGHWPYPLCHAASEVPVGAAKYNSGVLRHRRWRRSAPRSALRSMFKVHPYGLSWPVQGDVAHAVCFSRSNRVWQSGKVHSASSSGAGFAGRFAGQGPHQFCR